VRDAVAVIRDNNLPFKTVLLDEGWHRARGIWEPHPDRFADMRSFVDELHQQGFKVVIWWAWPEIEKSAESEMDPKLLMGQGKRNRHDALMYDFSNPVVQQEYLKPLFEKLFSDAPGCYNLDGIKTDFQADKIHADMPLTDDSWRGEENFLFRMHELFYTMLKSIKPDAVHIGCAGHYWLSQFIDINRTYDIHSSNVIEHETRARMLMSTTNDCPVAYDFHNFLDYLEDYFDSAARLGCSVEVGNVLTCQADPISPVQKADASYWQRLADKLNA
jgi:alpha-glucosidase (family GH31 glycosyl hydrolase)